MRTLPIGVPKLMVSTLASGDVAAYVDVSDITMMPSVTDIAGLNPISRVVLANAAYAIAGMARAAVPEVEAKPLIGLTMFGVTTPAVTQAVEQLRGDYDCLVFHATGTGGRAMEKLVDSRLHRRRDRRNDDGGLRPPLRRCALRRTRPARRDRPDEACPMSARSALSTWSISDAIETVPEKVPQAEPLQAQSAGHTYADHGGGEPHDGRVDRANG